MPEDFDRMPDEPSESFETLEQFTAWRQFAESNLIPLYERSRAELETVVGEIRSLEAADALTPDRIKEFTARIHALQGDFRNGLQEYREQMKKDFGPVIAITGFMVFHDIPKVYGAVVGHLNDMQSLLSGETQRKISGMDLATLRTEERVEEIVPEPLDNLGELFKRYGFTREFLLKLGVTTIENSQNTASRDARYRSELADNKLLSLQWEVETDIKMVSDRFPGIQITFQLSPDFGNYLPAESIMHKVIEELLINAAELSHGTGGVIQLRMSRDEKNYIIEVEDNGVGIPKENQSRIFERGFTTKTTGTGQGLFYIREAVEKVLRGTISVKSEADQGTIFRIEIPGRAEA